MDWPIVIMGERPIGTGMAKIFLLSDGMRACGNTRRWSGGGGKPSAK